MLQSLRDKTSGWIATLILGLLIIPFAFVGVNEYATGGSDSAVAKVQAPPTWWSSAPSWWPASMLWQHEDVTQEEFRAAFEQARQQQREEGGEDAHRRSPGAVRAAGRSDRKFSSEPVKASLSSPATMWVACGSCT